MWQLVTSVPKKKNKPSLFDQNHQTIMLESEKAVDHLTAMELNTDNGMKTLLNKLESVFQSEAIDEAYNVYSMFINFCS